jgi:hypothetical protein
VLNNSKKRCGRKAALFRKKRAKTFALRRGGGEAGVSRCQFAAAYTGLATPASQGKSFFGSFFTKKELLNFFVFSKERA